VKDAHEPKFFSTQVTQARRFYIQKPALADPRLNVVCGGCEQTTPDFRIDRKNFPYYSIEFVAKGKGVAFLDGHTFDLSAGSIFSYGPKIPHAIATDRQAPMLKYFIDFTGAAAPQILHKYVSSAAAAVRTNRPDEIRIILDELISHGLSDSRFRSNLCVALLDYLVLRIADTISSESTEISQAFLNYQRCRQHIKDHFMELHSLHAVAEICNTDPAYLCRLFKRFDTQGPYQYLIQLKMAYAAQHLHHPQSLVKEVAYKVGYDDPSHFTRTFTRVFGISPHKFKGLR